MHYNARVQDARLLELPEEADELGLKPGDEVEVSVEVGRHRSIHSVTPQARSPKERAKAYRAWAGSHSLDTPLLSDDAISRESIYGERG